MPLDLPSLQSSIWNRSDYGITWYYYVLLYYRANTRPNLATGKKQLEPLHHPKKKCSLLIMFQGLSRFSFFFGCSSTKKPLQNQQKTLAGLEEIALDVERVFFSFCGTGHAGYFGPNLIWDPVC